MQNLNLDSIALAESDLPEARARIASVLAQSSDKAARRVYVALRAWTWKALNGRRRDTELRGWYELIRSTSAAMEDRFPGLSLQMKVLHELLYESISASELLRVDELLRRKHVLDLLKHLAAAPEGRMDRDRLGKLLSLNQANLTRVLNMLTAAGLVERRTHGRQAAFELTKTGTEALKAAGFELGFYVPPHAHRPPTLPIVPEAVFGRHEALGGGGGLGMHGHEFISMHYSHHAATGMNEVIVGGIITESISKIVTAGKRYQPDYFTRINEMKGPGLSRVGKST